MKKFLLFLTAALFCLAPEAKAQIRQPVKWEVSTKKVKKNVYEIQASGKIRTGWHIYDLQEYVGGPNPTGFTVSGEAVEAVAPAKITSKVHRAMDDVFGMEIGTCENPVTIVQRVKTLQEGPCDVNVHIEWQACNKGNCLPPEEFEATVQVEGVKASAGGSLWALILEAIRP